MFALREAILACGFLVVCISWFQVAGRKGRTTGRIVGFERIRMSRGGSTMKPRIKFRVDGSEYSFIPSLYIMGDANEKRLNEEVPVAYNLAKPSDADIGTPERMYGPPIVLTILYIGVLVVAFQKQLSDLLN